MDTAKRTITRRQAAALSAAIVGLPAAATAVLATPAKPSLEDPIFRLLAAHKAAEDRYGVLAIEEDELVRSAPEDVTVFFYDSDAELAGFEPERIARIKAGDRWSAASGHDALVGRLNAALDEMVETEIAAMTTKSTTVAGVAAVLAWLDAKQARLPIEVISPLEAADQGVYRHLADSLNALVST
jgi:hypothetical protein